MANNLNAALEKAKQDIIDLTANLTGLQKVAISTSKNIVDILGKKGGNQKEFLDSLKKVNSELTKLDKNNKKIVTSNSNLKTKTEELIRAKKSLKNISSIEIANQKELRRQVDLNGKANSKLVGAYTNLIAKQKQSKKVLQDLIVSQGRNTAKTKQAQSAYNKLTSKVNQANKATSNFSKTGLGSMTRGFRNLLGAFGIIGGVQLFASMVSSAFQLTTALDSIGFSMRAVITDARELGQTQIWLKNITNLYGAELVTTTNRYIKFRAASKQAGMSATETQDIFGTMTKAAGVLGLKTDELTGIFLALEQMISKGKITTEELRRQLGERLPGAMDIMANSLGVTTAELDKMLRAGEVITKDVLPGFARQVEKSFGLDSVRKVTTLRAAITRLKNGWTTFVDDFAKGGETVSNLTTLIDYLADNFKMLFNVLITTIKWFGIYKLWMITTLALTNALTGANALYTLSLAGIRGGIRKTIASLTALKIATGATGIGLFLIALGAAYEIWQSFASGAKEATRELKDFTKATEIFNSVYGKVERRLSEVESLKKRINIADQNRIKILNELDGKIIEYSSNDLNANQEHINRANELIRNTKKLSAEETLSAAKRLGFNTRQRGYIISRMAEYKALNDVIQSANKKEEDSTKETVKFLNGSIAFYQKQISVAKEALKNSTLSTEEYEKQSKAIKDAEDNLDSLVRKVRELADKGDVTGINLESSGIDKSIFESFEDIEENIKKLNSGGIIVEVDSTKIQEAIDKIKKLEDLNEIFKGLTSTFSELFDIDMSKFDMFFDGEKNSIEEWADLSKELIGSVLDASMQRYEIELQEAQRVRDLTLNNDLASEEAKENARRKFDKEERRIKTEQAKKERENNLIKIAIDTAVAVTKTFAQMGFIAGIPLAAAMLGIGAAQAAIVASQPLPQFETGGTMAKDGWAITQEKRPEPIVDKFGNLKTMGSIGGDSMTYLNQGDRVFKSQDNFFKEFDVERSVFDMNMNSNGEMLNEKIVDLSLLREVGGLRGDIDKMGKRIEKMASRPINVNNTVEVKTEKPY